MRPVRPAVPVALAVAAITLALYAAAAAGGPDGKTLFTEKGCIACHSIGGPSPGVGPELTQTGWHRDAEWLRAWLNDPQKVKKGTVMPKIPFKSQQEMDAVIEYILQSKRPIPAADSSDGAKLFADFNCAACHSIHKKGGKPQFPDLGDEAKVHDAAWLDHWLADPSAVKKGTFMAKFPLTDTQRHALVAYIVSLAGTKTAAKK